MHTFFSRLLCRVLVKMGCCPSTTQRISPEINTLESPSISIVWLLSQSDKDILHKTVQKNPTNTNVKNVQVYDNADNCISYIRSIPQSKIILIVSSAFTNEISEKICSQPQVVSFIIFCPTRNQTSTTDLRRNYVASCENEISEIIDNDIDSINGKEHSIKVTMNEETINQLLSSFADKTYYYNHTSFLCYSVDRAFSFREPSLKLLRDKAPELDLQFVIKVNGHEISVHVHAQVDFKFDQSKNEIYLVLLRLNITDYSILKRRNVASFADNVIKNMRFSLSENVLPPMSINMSGDSSQKTLQASLYQLQYKVYDHYVVISVETKFTVDSGPERPH